jgi:hypothetical protein
MLARLTRMAMLKVAREIWMAALKVHLTEDSDGSAAEGSLPDSDGT